jgi:hypothetical protein
MFFILHYDPLIIYVFITNYLIIVLITYTLHAVLAIYLYSIMDSKNTHKDDEEDIKRRLEFVCEEEVIMENNSTLGVSFWLCLITFVAYLFSINKKPEKGV